MMGVRVEESGSAAVVVMDWPERRNALGPREAEEVAAAVAHAGTHAPAAVVLTGTRAFCAGGDLRIFADLSARDTPAEIEKHVYGRVQAMMRALRDCPVPTIAAVDGPAVGLGFDLALACDMRFIGPDGWFRQGWAGAGLIPGTGGLAFLTRLAPGLSWRLIASQEKLTAARCVELGLGEAALSGALSAATARAGALAAIDREVLGHYCRMERQLTWPDDAFFSKTARVQGGLIGSEQFRDLAARTRSAKPHGKA
jgi:enoyl-CoA hydratase/carnithine racemase